MSPTNKTPLTTKQAKMVADNIELVGAYYSQHCDKYKIYLRDNYYNTLTDTLIRCVRAFKPELGNKFSTYCYQAFKYATYRSSVHKWQPLCITDCQQHFKTVQRIVQPKTVQWAEMFRLIHYANLKPNEKLIIILRFKNNLTLQAAGEAINRTKERARQLQNAAIKKLQSAANRMELEMDDVEG